MSGRPPGESCGDPYCTIDVEQRQGAVWRPCRAKTRIARRISGRSRNSLSPGTVLSRGRGMEDGDRVCTEERRRAAVLAGDERAWLEWYEATYDDLRAYAHWRCAGLRHLADEVIQEAWL